MLLHHSRRGKGPKLLLIHGFLEDSTMWDYLNLEDFFDCLRIDLPGHGRSPEWSKDRGDLAFAAQSVVETIEANGFDNFQILGHSLGGYVALHLADHFPRAKLMLLNSNFWTDSTAKQQDRLRVVNIVEQNRLFFIREALPNLFHEKEKYQEEIASAIQVAKQCSTQSIQAATVAMMNRQDFSRKMDQVKSRLLILQGEEDKSTVKEELLRRSVGLEVIVLPNCGHMSHIEQTGMVVKEVKQFFLTNA